MKSFLHRWKIFLGLIFEPWTLMLIISVLALFFLSKEGETKILESIIFVVMTITSAVLGGRITKHLSDVNGTGILAGRGEVAVRSLMVLLKQILEFEQRVENFSRQEKIATDNRKEVTIRNYEEAVLFCRNMEEQITSSIENWKDILPNASIKTQIGEITNLKNAIEAKELELVVLKQKSEEKSAQEQEKFKDKMEEKELEIKKLKGMISQRQIELSSNISSPDYFRQCLNSEAVRNKNNIPLLLGNESPAQPFYSLKTEGSLFRTPSNSLLTRDEEK